MLLRTFQAVIPLILAFSLLPFSTAHRIEIDPGEKECYHETLQPQDRVSLYYNSTTDCLRFWTLIDLIACR